jgi:3-methyladenine DNA glycosylase/8-oxoguanine DNA glycosylase
VIPAGGDGLRPGATAADSGGGEAGRDPAVDHAAAGGGAADGAPIEARFDAPRLVDLRLSMEVLRHGPGDPTIRFGRDGAWLARRTEAGPACLRIWIERGETAVRAQAWGPGAEQAMQAVPGLAGLLDEPDELVAQHPLVRDLQRRFAGLGLTRTGQLLPALIPAVTEQKVTAGEAHGAYSALVRRLGEPAPGPLPLRLPPTGPSIAALPYFEFHPMGLERRRAELIIRIARLEPRIEALMALDPAAASLRLREIPGVGPWTAAEACRVAFGDPDAVSLGDAHLPDLVAWSLAREPRGDDARMLELLAPYAGQRGRVVRLLEVSRIAIPRFGPRFSPRHIERI